MTSHGNGPPLVYEIHFSGNAPEQVKQRFHEATKAGKGKRFLRALRTIIEHLRHHPHTFGDPLYRLPALKLLVYHGVVAPLLVDYGVHEEQALVFIRSVRVL